MSHLDQPWFQEAKDRNGKINKTFGYNIQYLKKFQKEFYQANYHQVDPYRQQYVPNPFLYQYDLTVFCWLYYYSILRKEIQLLSNQGNDDLAEELFQTQKIYGISREDFLFAAAELRWPTRNENGSMRGTFVRDPWSERRVAAISDPNYKYVFSFGGGGQGKTHVYLAVLSMIFDYFLFTQKGARCMISTTNEDKLEGVSWSYLSNIYSATEKGISLTAGRAENKGGYTLRRPQNKEDKAGVFKGLLVGRQINDQAIVDKLTGTHGHPFIGYIIDEMQSTPAAPLRAAPNFTMHAKSSLILGAGNYGENDDTLANNIRPIGGWGGVTPDTGQWISQCENGAKALVLHFNNSLSPGMTDEGHKKWPHLPHKSILDEKYPDKASRNPDTNISYRRFWIGWRVDNVQSRNVLSQKFIDDNLASSPLNLRRVIHNFGSFDSAPAEIDRNLLNHLQEGICAVTGKRVFGPKEMIALTKSTDSLKYYQESSAKVLAHMARCGIKSGALILDWTGRPAHAEQFNNAGFACHRMVYNKQMPDGVRKNERTGLIERPIKLNVQLEFKEDIPVENLYAHHTVENVIAFGAWLLREYCKVGRVRGLTVDLLTQIQSPRTFEEEMFYREYELVAHKKYGDRFKLESKNTFKVKHKFSPDILDTLFQAAYYMFMVRNLPLTIDDNDDIIPEDQEETEADTSFLWEGDGLYELDQA